jgi:CHASE2 domain-containing sensor protein
MRQPYRFGYAWAIVNLLGGLYSAYLAIKTLAQTWAGFAEHLVWALITVGIGIGLLRRKRYGLFLLYFTILSAWIGAAFSWFQPIEIDWVLFILVNLGLLAATVVLVAYFYKRRKEFS